MIKLLVKGKGRKPTIWEYSTRQEAIAASQSWHKGCKCKIMEQGPAPKQSNVRGHTQVVWKKEFNMNEHGISKASPYNDYITSLMNKSF